MTSIDTNSPKVRQRLLLANHIADLTSPTFSNILTLFWTQKGKRPLEHEFPAITTTLRSLISLLKWAIPGLFLIYIRLFQLNITIFTRNKCEKMPIQYTVLGFEPMKFGK